MGKYWSRHLYLPGALLLLALLIALGPRVSAEFQPRPVTLANDLEGYLAKSEAQFPDIRSGTDKRIIWADPRQQEQTEFAIVYLHGFSASRYEVYPLCDRLAQRLQANLFYTRLRGHGRSDTAMGEATVSDWTSDALEALRIGQRLGRKVIVIGSSTGATLALWLASYLPQNEIHALILMSPNLGPQDWRAELLLWPWAGILMPKIFGSDYSWEPSVAAQAQYWTLSYPVAALFQMMLLVDEVRKIDHSSITVPTQVFYVPNDLIVDSRKTVTVFHQLGAKQKVLIPVDSSEDPQQHIIAGEILSPSTSAWVEKEIMAFFIALENSLLGK